MASVPEAQASEQNDDDIIEVPSDSTSSTNVGRLAAVISKRLLPDLAKCRSQVYKGFNWEASVRLWNCRFCSKTYEHHKGMGSAVLSKHLKDKHLEHFRKLTTDEQPPSGSVAKFTEKIPKKTPPPPVTAAGFKDRLIRLVVTTDQPFRVVEDESLREYSEYISKSDPNAQLPSRTAIREWISEKYQQELKKIFGMLANNESKVSFAIDGWTSANQISFLGVIATWVDEDWKLRTTVVDFATIEGPHSGENLAHAFGSVLTNLKLWTKMISVTTDNASNMDTMFTELDKMALENSSDFKSVDHRVRCLAHIINLACQAVLLNVTGDIPEESDHTSLIGKIRHGVVSLRSSSQRRTSFKVQCEKYKVKHRNLIRDVRTRWNSTLDMLQRVKEVKAGYDAALAGNPDIAKYKLNEDEWEKVDILIKFLQPFKEATVLLSTGKSPILSDTASVYDTLFTHLEKYATPTQQPSSSKRMRVDNSVQDDQWLANAANLGWEKLKAYYPTSDGLIYIVATVLDPRLKLQWFKALDWQSEWQRNAKKAVEKMWESYKVSPQQDDSNEQQSTTQQSKVTAPGQSFHNLFMEKMKKFHKSDDELKRYLSEPVAGPEQMRGTGVLDWWKSHQYDYPNLSRMARDVMSAQGTGVSVERLFSSGPDLLAPRRRAMLGSTIRECLCLKYWLRNSMKNLEEFQKSARYKALGGVDDDDSDELTTSED